MQAIAHRGDIILKTVLIKCGGSTLAELSKEFFDSLKELKQQGYGIIIVHGGGPDINEMLDILNVQPEFDQGLRKTNEETFNVVELVLSGRTNRNLVKKLTDNGLLSIGLNGSDAETLIADYVDRDRLGLVGEIQSVNTEFIELFIEKGVIPVITPIALGKDGVKLNVNADYAAAAVANALNVENCLFVTDVEGIMVDGRVQETMTIADIEKYMKAGDIYGGMIPKVQSAISAIRKGIESVRIVSGKKSFYCYQEWYGTKIHGEESVVL